MNILIKISFIIENVCFYAAFNYLFLFSVYSFKNWCLKFKRWFTFQKDYNCKLSLYKHIERNILLL